MAGATRSVILRFLSQGDKSVSTTLNKLQGQKDDLTKTEAVLTIKADDTEGTAKLDAFLRKAQEAGNTKVSVKIGADAESFDATYAAVKAKADELGLKKVNIKVSTDGTGKSIIALSALATEVAAVNKESSNTPGLLSSIGRSGANAANGLGEMIPVLGSIAPSSGVGGLFAIPVAIAAVAAALTEATGLVAGFAAAGAGAGAFGLLAIPAFKAVSGALTQAQADQTAYDRALTKTAKNTALQHLKADYASLDPSERGAVKGIQTLSSTFSQMAQSFEPQVFTVFNSFLGVANSLLPDIAPFAVTFASAFADLGNHLKNFTNSGPFLAWISQFQKLEGPAIGAIGAGIGKLGVAFGKLLVVMPPKDVVNAINIGFGIMAGVINTVTWTVKTSMWWWDTWTRNFALGVEGLIRGWNTFAGVVRSAWNNVIRPTFALIVDTFLGIVGAIIDGAARAFGWIPGIGGKLKNAARSFDSFRDSVNNSLSGINDKSVSVKVNFAPTPSGQEGASKFTHAATGGLMRGPGSSTADKIPAMLSNGEYVHKASAVAHYGVGAMDAVNQGRAVIQYASGGSVGHKAHLAHLHHEHVAHMAHLAHLRHERHTTPHHTAAHKATGAHTAHLAHLAHMAHLKHEHREHLAHLTHMKSRKGYANGGLVGFQGFAGGGGVNVNTSFPSASSVNSSVASAVQNLANAHATSLFSSVSAASGGSGSGSNPGGGAAQWASLVLQVLSMYGLSAGWLPNVLRQINTESGGNPNAINLWDSNAAAGDPSRGLMQTIMSTFLAYAGPFAGRGIYDPFANIYAAIGYTLSRYGSLSVLGNGHGYKNGTNSARAGLALVGENGPELVNFRGGESVTPNSKLGGNTYQIQINVPPNANQAEIGRVTVNAIKQFEKQSGASWRS